MKQFVSFCFVCLLIFVSACKRSAHLYEGEELQTIRVPAGGIGTGDLMIGGRGNIEFVEVFNRPDRQRHLEKTFFSLWVKEDGKRAVSTILERELLPPFLDVTHTYGWGLPRMTEARFVNHYPQLQWQFEDDDVPVDVSHGGEVRKFSSWGYPEEISDRRGG